MAKSTPPILPVAIGAFAIVAYLLLIDLSIGTFSQDKKVSTNTNAKTACSREARLCPDGTYVGRTEANCAFESCPDVPAVTADSTKLETYTGEFGFQYPAGWGMPYINTVTPASDSDLYTGAVSQVSFNNNNTYTVFSVFSDNVTGALPYSLEGAILGECVNGLMTYSPSHEGAKFPCKKVTIAGHDGVLLIRNVAQEGCYDFRRDYYLSWSSGSYKDFVAEQGPVELFDVPGPNNEIYCTQDVDVAKRMQEVLDEKNLTTEQQRRIDEFDAAVASIKVKNL